MAYSKPEEKDWEKRGVVTPGWTPESDFSVKNVPSRNSPDLRKEAGKSPSLDELDNDISKRLADGFSDMLQ